MPAPRSLTTIAACLATGCFAPFPHDRHDLVDFRIIGVQVDDATPAPGDLLSAKALVYGGDGFYHDRVPTLEWSLGEATAQGPQVELAVPEADGSWELELSVTHADGALSESAVLPLYVASDNEASPPPTLRGIGQRVVDLGLDATAEAMSLDARAELEILEAEAVGEGQAARLRVALDSGNSGYRARWMSAGARGTFLELDEHTADWLPAEVFLDEEDAEVEVLDPLEPGLYGVAVLVIDEVGSNAWAFADIVMGQEELASEGGTRVEHAGRVFVGERLPPSGLVRVTVVQDDDSPWGVSFQGWEPVTIGAARGDVFGTTELACEHPIPSGEPFQLDWLAEGLCSRQAVVGAELVLDFTHPTDAWNED